MTRFKKIVLSLASGLMLFSAGMAGAQTLEPVRFGVDAYTTGSQIWVAKEKGFFEKEGIDAQITTFATGVEAIDALLIGRADMAVGLDLPPKNSMKVKPASATPTRVMIVPETAGDSSRLSLANWPQTAARKTSAAPMIRPRLAAEIVPAL